MSSGSSRYATPSWKPRSSDWLARGRGDCQSIPGGRCSSRLPLHAPWDLNWFLSMDLCVEAKVCVSVCVVGRSTEVR